MAKNGHGPLIRGQNGQKWPKMAILGSKWPKMTIFDPPGQTLKKPLRLTRGSFFRPFLSKKIKLIFYWIWTVFKMDPFTNRNVFGRFWKKRKKTMRQRHGDQSGPKSVKIGPWTDLAPDRSRTRGVRVPSGGGFWPNSTPSRPPKRV